MLPAAASRPFSAGPRLTPALFVDSGPLCCGFDPRRSCSSRLSRRAAPARSRLPQQQPPLPAGGAGPSRASRRRGESGTGGAAAAGTPCLPPSPRSARSACRGCCCSASASRAAAPQVSAPRVAGRPGRPSRRGRGLSALGVGLGWGRGAGRAPPGSCGGAKVLPAPKHPPGEPGRGGPVRRLSLGPACVND